MTVLLTLLLTGCSDNIPDNITSPTEANEAEEGYYTANFNVSIPSLMQFFPMPSFVNRVLRVTCCSKLGMDTLKFAV